MHEDIDSKRFILFSPWTFLFVFLIIIIGNLFIIDVALFKGKPLPIPFKIGSQNSSDVNQKLQTQNSVATKTDNVCPISCLTEIKKTTAIISPQIVKTQSSNPQASTREYFVPLGSGSSLAKDWEDIPGATAYIDSTAYSSIKKVVFEVSLYTPTGNQTAYARLYNVTDKHPVWYSEVSIEGGTPQTKISNNIILDTGNKLYQVQMKTQLQARTNLENARVHIITN